MNIFVRMLREVYHISDPIVESPPRIALKMFGGPFDIEAFRAQKNVTFVMHPPFVSYCMLIEERQPIQSIGEGVPGVPTTQRGSVKGLRRPSEGSVNVVQDEIGTPQTSGMYLEFLEKTQHAALPSSSSTPVQPNKKAKVDKGGAKGLAKFMCPS